MDPQPDTEVDANELINDLAQQIAFLTVQLTALRLENRKLKAGTVA